MKKVPLEKVQARLGEYIDACSRQSIIILNDGHPVAMLVAIQKTGENKPRKLRDILARAWQEYEQHGGMSHEQFWQEIDGPSIKPASKKAAGRRGRAKPVGAA